MTPRAVSFLGPHWSPKGTYAVLDIRSDDNKDRWLMLWDTASNKLKLLDRQRDEAWIGGPGIIWQRTGWIDENTFLVSIRSNRLFTSLYYQCSNRRKESIDIRKL